jgi:carbon-monoxide dehydrogenase medium subunit
MGQSAVIVLVSTPTVSTVKDDEARAVSLSCAQDVDEAVRPSPRLRARTDACWPAAKAWCRSWRSAWRVPATSSTSTAWRVATLAVDGDKLSIGACVRHAAFHKPVVDGPLGRLLAASCATSRTIRSAPAAHFAAASPMPTRPPNGALVAAALDAEMVAKSATGTRSIAAQDFFRGIMTTALREDELLTEVRLPILPADTRFGFYEFNRRAGDFALAMALVTYRLQDGVISEPRVAVGGVEPQPRRIEQAERALAGRAPGRAAFEAAAAAVGAAVDPLDDATTSASYRRDLAQTVTRRALEQAAA